MDNGVYNGWIINESTINNRWKQWIMDETRDNGRNKG